MYSFKLTNQGCARYLHDFCRKYDYPTEAEASLSDSFAALTDHSAEYGEFMSYIQLYYENYELAYLPIAEKLTVMSERVGVHTYTLQLLYMILLTPRLHELYAERGYSDEIFDSSVLDLKWKLFECRDVYGIWGSFVAWWTIGFFKLKRFGFGRLECNLRKCKYSYSDGVKSINEGDMTVDVHIPSSGPLKREEYLESYRRAAEFFAEHFSGEYTVFSCHSWLLSPNNNAILPPNSRIREFAADYTLISAEDDPKNENLWRIFGKLTLEDGIESLPADSSLRRNFIKWLERGRTIGQAYGVFFYKDGEIVK